MRTNFGDFWRLKANKKSGKTPNGLAALRKKTISIL
jgi:hypothetical protein